MNLRIFLALIFTSILMSGCATTEEVDYENNSVAPPLEIPPDLISRSQKGSSTTGKN